MIVSFILFLIFALLGIYYYRRSTRFSDDDPISDSIGVLACFVLAALFGVIIYHHWE